MAADSRARARDRLLYLLKTRGPQTAADLARRLDVTPMAVRQHLATLSDEGHVEHTEERRGVGRPVRIWSLTRESDARFPDTHAELTVDLLESLGESFGEAGVDRLLGVRMKRQLATYREHVPKKAPLDRKVASLAAIRRREGYMAEWVRRGDGFLLIENHCPICAAATACQGLCRDELRLFREVLGPGVHVERSEHILQGARRCAYSIERAKRKRKPGTR